MLKWLINFFPNKMILYLYRIYMIRRMLAEPIVVIRIGSRYTKYLNQTVMFTPETYTAISVNYFSIKLGKNRIK